MCKLKLFGGFSIKLFYQKDKLVINNNSEDHNNNKKGDQENQHKNELHQD